MVLLPSRAGASDRTALMLGKRNICAPQSLPNFARSLELTQAETLVLECLCSGAAPGEIARTLAVEVCTACTQISAIRARTAALDILSSQHMLPVLPPVVWAIRVSGQR